MSCCCGTWTVLIILAIAVALALFKLFRVLSLRWNDSHVCLVGKTTIVTGANTGIGYYTALDFAKRGAKVILACRDKDRAEKARKDIIAASGNEHVFVRIIDMASLDSVRKFAKDFNETEERLDILVNNAGAMYLGNKITNDGLQLLVQVNHFGNFLLTNLLIEKLKFSAPSRVVNVSSFGAKFGEVDPKNLNAYPEGFMTEAKLYSNTKLLNVLFTNELARKLERTGVTANSLHPGSIKTEINRNMSQTILKIIRPLLNTFIRSAEEGAQTTLYVALSNDIKNITGRFFDNCRQTEMYESCKSVALSKRVWEKSEELVKLTPEERKI